jgi:AraC-like DNA-binding protein
VEPRFVVYLLPNFVVVLTRLALAAHQHHTWQLTISLRPITLTVEDRPIVGRGVLIAPDVVHATPAGEHVIVSLLFEPVSAIGQQLTAAMQPGQAYYVVADDHIDSIAPLMEMCRMDIQLPPDQLRNLCAAALDALVPTGGTVQPNDERITAALRLLQASPEETISASQVASQVALSETRFLHLFRAQLGTTFRAFLLWLRLGRALKHIWRGQSLTHAAHSSGFADSAHLSRTGRQMFGRPLSQLFGDPQSFRVYSYLYEPFANLDHEDHH